MNKVIQSLLDRRVWQGLMVAAIALMTWGCSEDSGPESASSGNADAVEEIVENDSGVQDPMVDLMQRRMPEAPIVLDQKSPIDDFITEDGVIVLPKPASGHVPQHYVLVNGEVVFSVPDDYAEEETRAYLEWLGEQLRKYREEMNSDLQTDISLEDAKEFKEKINSLADQDPFKQRGYIPKVRSGYMPLYVVIINGNVAASFDPSSSMKERDEYLTFVQAYLTADRVIKAAEKRSESEGANGDDGSEESTQP